MDSWRSSCLLVGALFAVLKLTTAVVVSQVNCTAQGNECSSITHSACVSGKCQCLTDFGEDLNDKSTCVKIVTATDCTGAAACSGIDNSACNTGKCKCLDGFTVKVNKCVKVLGSSCSADTVCTVAHSECQTTSCKCKKGYTEVNDVCKKVLGSICIGTAACTGDANSVCQNTECVCKKDYDEKDGVCVPTVSGTTCTASGKECDSINNAECDGKKCKCSSGYTMKVDVCAAENAAPSMELGRVALSLSIFMLTLLKNLF